MAKTRTVSNTAPRDSQIWACGLPKVSERAATNEEASRLRAESQRLLVANFKLWLTTLSGFTLLYWSSQYESLMPAPLLTVMSALYFACPLIGTGLTLVISRDFNQRRHAIEHDIAGNVVFRFEGEPEPVGSTIPYPPAVTLKAGEPITEPLSGVRSFEIWPKSGITAGVDLVEGGSLAAIPHSEVSATPMIAKIAAQWVEPVGILNGKTISTNYRELSSAEVDELKRYRRDAWWKPMLPTLLLSAWSGCLIGLMVTGHHSDSLFGTIMTYLIIAETGFLWFVFIQGIRRATKLSKDIKAGRAMILRMANTPSTESFEESWPPAIAATNEESDEQTRVESVDRDYAASADLELTEWLPHANEQWTIAFRPAPWRRTANQHIVN